MPGLRVLDPTPHSHRKFQCRSCLRMPMCVSRRWWMPAADCSPKETDLPSCDLYRGGDLSGSLAGPYQLISRIGTQGPADIYVARSPQSATAQAIVKVV